MCVLLVVKISLVLYTSSPLTLSLAVKVFYHQVLSYLLDPVDLCCVLWVSVLMILNLAYLSHVSCLRSMYYWGFSWALCLVTLCKFPGFSYSCHLKF